MTDMKLTLHLGALLFFLFFLVSSSQLSARPLTMEQGRNKSKLNQVSGEDFVLELEGGESFKLLGMEDCNNGDEECVQRRMTLEAHLDYIYTQHHKP
ncbi:putative phytosulfokines 6, partial [Mucuna pruriens]